MTAKTKYKKWIKITGGIITDIYSSNTDQPGMIEVSWNSNVKLGEHIIWYDKNRMRIPDNVLAGRGIRIDNRGQYWNKNNYLQNIIINELDIAVPEGFTNIAPIQNEPCLWENGKWVIDENKKEREKIISELENIDRQAGAGRKFRAIAVGIQNLLNQLQENAPEIIPDFDPLKHEDLRMVVSLEHEAEILREKLKEWIIRSVGTVY